ncbi:DNA polymerase III subunit gamma/tau, partial [Enterococcus sp. S181_ASV_20]|nr:DNA polymerase III subunit gamma/tau [Enterococcus sp. S181_ASV_20]
MIKILSETQNEIRFTNHANVYLEVATVKLATPQTSANIAIGDSSSNQIAVASATQPADQAEFTALKTQIQ